MKPQASPEPMTAPRRLWAASAGVAPRSRASGGLGGEGMRGVVMHGAYFMVIIITV